MPDVTSPFAFPYPEDTDLVRDGATDIENLAEGVNDYLAGGYLYAGTVYFTSSGSFLKADPLGTGDIGLRAIRVTVIGAGGGAGAVPASGAGESGIAGSGGGGAGCQTFITDIAGLSASETITRGSGGAGGTSGAAGTQGGSSVAFSATAPGGLGGEAGLSLSISFVRPGGSNPAATGTFDIELHGAGADGSVSVNPGTGAAATAGSPGHSYIGGRLSTGRDNLDSSAGLVAGEGARAGAIRASQSARDGAAGANGIVIIDCFV